MTQELVLGAPNDSAKLRFYKDLGWGISLERDKGISFRQPTPIYVEYFLDESTITKKFAPYDTVEIVEAICIAKARVEVVKNTYCAFVDRWTMSDNQAHLSRQVTVEGQADGGFLTGIVLTAGDALTWLDLDAFAPGMI